MNFFINDYIAEHSNELIMLTFIILLILPIIIFFIMREVSCWYFKINQRIALAEEADKDRKDIIKLLLEISDTPENSNNKDVQKQG